MLLKFLAPSSSRHFLQVFLVSALTVGLSGCTTSFVDFEGEGWVESDETLEFRTVSNTNDVFQYAAYMVNVDDSEQYDWSNSKFGAFIQWAGSTQSGSATLIVSDGTGLARTTIDLSDTSGGQQNTPRGIPFGWTVEVEYENFTGALSFQVVANNSELEPSATSVLLK